MHVVMLDPSNFSPPYDDHLCTALGSAGASVTLYTRPVRQHEGYSRSGYVVREHFYRGSEWLYRHRLFRPVYRYVKVLEHAIGLIALYRQLRRVQPDVIHYQWCPLPVLDALFLASFRRIAPIVLTVHNSKPFHGNPSSRLQGMGWQKILRVFDRLIVHTEQSRQHLLSAGCPQEKVVVIPHGALQVRAGSPEEGEPREPGKQDGRKTILFFGNVKPYKGVDVLLRAFSRIPLAARGNARILIAGRSSIPLGELENLISDLGIQDAVQLDLRFLPDEELSELLGTASMVVFPYRDIDASGALMLALPYGKPVVASRLGVFSELLKDGETALLAGVDDTDAFAKAIERILTDEALSRRLGEGARQVAGQYRSWDEIAQMTLTAYQDLAARHRNRGI